MQSVNSRKESGYLRRFVSKLKVVHSRALLLSRLLSNQVSHSNTQNWCCSRQNAYIYSLRTKWLFWSGSSSQGHMIVDWQRVLNTSSQEVVSLSGGMACIGDPCSQFTDHWLLTVNHFSVHSSVLGWRTDSDHPSIVGSLYSILNRLECWHPHPFAVLKLVRYLNSADSQICLLFEVCTILQQCWLPQPSAVWSLYNASTVLTPTSVCFLKLVWCLNSADSHIRLLFEVGVMPQQCWLPHPSAVWSLYNTSTGCSTDIHIHMQLEVWAIPQQNSAHIHVHPQFVKHRTSAVALTP